MAFFSCVTVIPGGGRATDMQQYKVNKYASVIYRMSHAYFDIELKSYHIGCGQQFFLLRIFEQKGISLAELAQTGYFDKGTVTRAVSKLAEQGYVEIRPDKADKRIHRLYTTAQAEPVVDATYKMLDRWDEVVLTGLSREERDIVDRLLAKMAENACRFTEERKKKECSKEQTLK